MGRSLDFTELSGGLDLESALIYDAVHLFALALDELSKIQEINIVPINCEQGDSWEHGSSLINYMKLREFTGLSGRIKFDTQGLRTLFDIGKIQAFRNWTSLCLKTGYFLDASCSFL